tara:strand:+ start:2895 stop:3275 length:381 start_codon:yes stop_codon:yes gene_type:complete
MSAPNIVNVSSIVGFTTHAALGTSASTIVGNANASGKVYKINSIVVSNVDGSNSANVFVKYYSEAATATGESAALAHEIAVAADSSLVVLDKASSIYLEENNAIGAYASASGDLDIIIGYEVIDDA